jgi:integrase
MKGHIRQRSPGRWAIVLDSRDAETGRRKRKWHSFVGTKREAQIECSRLISEIAGGGYADPVRETLAAFLTRWLEHMRGQVAPRTHERYGELVRNHLVPLLGATLLSNLQPVAISRAYAKALACGRRDGQGGLSPRTVHHLHRVLRQALHQAVGWRLLVRNPADTVKPPRVELKQMRTLDTDGTIELIEAARETRLFVPILLGVLCGLRRGEVAALRWRSINLDAGTLAVVASTEQTNQGIREKETKSGKSRAIILPALVAEELRQHRIRQAEELLKLGVRLDADHHVVVREDGEPLQPRSLTHAFTKFVRQRGLQRIRLHDLRHSHATHMLQEGVHPKIAQERLGHSSVSVTIDLYSHVLPGMQAEAVSRVDAAMQDALNRRAAKKKW